MEEELHPFDQEEVDAEKSQREFLKKALLDSSLVYNVFSTEAGTLLIERWKEVLMHTPTASANLDLISIGMNEGYKAFIRSIMQAIQTHKDQP